MFKKSLLVFASGLFSISVANADFTPDIGARVGVAAAQDMLASPPIPSLESGGRITVTPQVGYLSAKVDGQETQEGVPGLTYSGSMKGFSGGIGLTIPNSGRLGWFFLAVGNNSSGEIDVSQDTMNFRLKDIKSQAVAAAGGFNYRFIGEANSALAAGFFLGPAVMSVKSTFTLASTSGPAVAADYAMDETIYGAYGGLQLKLRIGNVVINPYALYMKEFSPECKKMTVSNGGEFVGLCETNRQDVNSVSMKSSFGGYGLFLGYRRLRLNVYSKAVADSSFDDIKATNYSLSYAFGTDF